MELTTIFASLIFATKSVFAGIIYPSQLNARLADEKCFAKGDFMPAYDEVTDQYNCFALTTKGPCQDSEWFVLDELDPDVKAVCKERPCNGNSVLVPFGKTCAAIYSTLNCTFGMQMQVNPFGKGECDCSDNFLSWIDEEDGVLRCYQEYLRGPCEKGQQYVLPEKSSEPVCKSTKCPNDDQIRLEDLGCINVPTCAENKAVMFELEGGLNSTCIDMETFDNRASLIHLPKSCGQGKRQDKHGICRKFSSRKRKRRSALAYGRQTNLRSYIKQRRNRRHG